MSGMRIIQAGGRQCAAGPWSWVGAAVAVCAVTAGSLGATEPGGSPGSAAGSTTGAAVGPAGVAPATPTGAPASPSLDELLGITPAGTATPGRTDPLREDLDQRLRDAPSADAAGQFAEAVALMRRVATRLEGSGERGPDTSIDTQRMQEDIIRKLDSLISQARRQQQQQQQQQSSQDQQRQAQSRQQQQQQQMQQQANQQQRQSSQAQASDARAQDSDQNRQLPGAQAPVQRPQLDAARAAWGALPERVRDMLLQGSGEKFSPTYQQLTEEYYRRLAEQRR
jgi:flagellar biosynthesis GTPase FlhF